MTLRWHVYVDWDGDGIFDADEGERLTDLSVERGRDRMITRDGLAPMSPGKAKLRLDNWDGRFDAWNTSSPLYPNVLPGRDVHIQVEADGVTYDVLRGLGSELVTYGYDEPRAELTVSDGWEFLAQRSIQRSVSTNVTTGVAIGYALASAGWTAPTDLDAGSDTLPYWWANGVAADEIHALVASEFGFGYVSADGTFVFVERRAQYGAQPVLTLAQSELLRDLQFGQPSESVRNIVRVRAQPRVVAAFGDIWKHGGVLTVGIGQTEVLDIELEHPAINMTGPVANTDYTVNTMPDGSGLDITNLVTVTRTAYGEGARLELTNLSNNYDAHFTLLKLRGNALIPSPVTAVVEDAASQAVYGLRDITLNFWSQDAIHARAQAEWIASWMATPTPSPRVTIEARPALQFGHDLGTILRLDVPHVGLDNTFRIGKLSHRWLNESGTAVRTTWHLEPLRLQDYWRLGTSQLGGTTKLGF